MSNLFTIDLDVAHDCPRSEISKMASEFEVTFTLLQEHGPAGGNPLYKVTGSREGLEDLIRAHFHAGWEGDEHSKFLISQLKPV